MSDVDQLPDVFRQAADIAGLVPESMQAVAFLRAVDVLIELPPAPRSTRGRSQGRRRTPPSARSDTTDDDPVEALNAGLDRTSHREVASAGSVRDRALWLLRIAKDELDIDGLTAPQIAAVLTNKFRLRTTRQAVGQALDRAGNVVDRVPDAPATVYRIMRPGEDYLDSLAQT
ncbi:MAG: hypothetical protein ACRDY6_07530 [Acidimicrobiia bacterium]